MKKVDLTFVEQGLTFGELEKDQKSKICNATVSSKFYATKHTMSIKAIDVHMKRGEISLAIKKLT